MNLVGLIIFISLGFSVNTYADRTCNVPACDQPPLFENLRESGRLVEDSKGILSPLLGKLSFIFGSNGEHCPTDQTGSTSFGDNASRSSDVFTGLASSEMGNLSTVSSEKAHQLFETLKKDCRLPFKMNIDGCYERAHAMAKLASDIGVNVAKVFFRSDSRGGLTMKNPITGQSVTTSKHAAIAVAVKEDSGQIKPYVIDPSVTDHPVPLQEYRALLSVHESAESVRVQFLSRYHYSHSQDYQARDPHDSSPNGWGKLDAHETEHNLNDYRRIQHHFESDDPARCNCVGRVLNEFSSLIPAETHSVIQSECDRMNRRGQ